MQIGALQGCRHQHWHGKPWRKRGMEVRQCRVSVPHSQPLNRQRYPRLPPCSHQGAMTYSMDYRPVGSSGQVCSMSFSRLKVAQSLGVTGDFLMKSAVVHCAVPDLAKLEWWYLALSTSPPSNIHILDSRSALKNKRVWAAQKYGTNVHSYPSQLHQ